MARSPRVPTRPVPGYYLLRRVRRGWAVPCQVIADAGRFMCILNGEPLTGAWSEDELSAFWADYLTAESVHPLVQIQLHGVTCDKATYDHRLAMKAWAERNQPDHPCLHPIRPIDPNKMPADEF